MQETCGNSEDNERGEDFKREICNDGRESTTGTRYVFMGMSNVSEMHFVRAIIALASNKDHVFCYDYVTAIPFPPAPRHTL